jgi:hypothetical protein
MKHGKLICQWRMFLCFHCQPGNSKKIMAVGTDQMPFTSKEFLLGGIAMRLLIHGEQHLGPDPDIPMFLASLAPIAARLTVYDVRHITSHLKIHRYVITAMKSTVNDEYHRLQCRL